MGNMNMRKAYGEALLELGRSNEKIVALEADLGKSTMSNMFGGEFPERYFQMGIAEANMISAAAGLALTGHVAYASTFAVFASGRPYDQIRSSVAILQQIPLYVEEAALSLGSSKPKAFFTVTLPMMSSGVLSGAILSWVTLISELSTAILLYTGKTQTLTVAIYTQIVRGNYGIASAMATVLTVMTLLSLVIFNKISKDGDLTM